MDEAKSQSYAKTPRLDHIVFAHWIPEALQADAESVVKSFRAKMGSRVGALKRAASARQQDANEKSNSGDGDTYSWCPSSIRVSSAKLHEQGVAGKCFTSSRWLSDDGTTRAEWTADAPTMLRDLRPLDKTE